jgi:hypothetical protein
MNFPTPSMKGNFHVRFLGGRGRATARAYPASPRLPLPVWLMQRGSQWGVQQKDPNTPRPRIRNVVADL